MELIDGHELKGPLPAETAIEYAKQILDALAAAHSKSITHRDLKPANILVTKQGIKLLDFGLAKQETILKQTDATLTKALTSDGQILGTLQYMSPEQLQAKPADARSDIFAFGCVLYEILSGQKAFQADSAANIIAAIIHQDPAPINTTKTLQRVITKCLAKDPDSRFQTARDLKYNLTLETQPTQIQSKWPYAIAAATLIIGAIVGHQFNRAAPTNHPPIRFQLHPPEGGRFSQIGNPALSPDGRTIAFAANAQGKSGLWLRPLDSTAARFLPGTEAGRFPIWSPDGRSLAYGTRSALMRIEIDGGTPVTISNGSAVPAFWTNDGQIIAGGFSASFLRSLPASGGDSKSFSTPDSTRGERSISHPRPLPGGRFLFHVAADKPENTGIFVASIANPAERTRVLTAAPYAFYAGGHLLWPKGSTLMAQPFDAATLQLSGEPQPIASPLNPTPSPASAGGLLVYRSEETLRKSQLTWFDHAGKASGTLGQLESISWFRLSPDGRRVVATHGNVATRGGLWTSDVDRNAWSRFTFQAEGASVPIWSPDSRQIVFISGQPGNMYSKPANGAGTETRITNSPTRQWPTDWSRDGRFILYYELAPGTQRDLWILPVSPDGKPELAKARPYLNTKANEYVAKFSPEPSPRWVAYRSDESGRDEVYIQAFPDPRGKWQISNGGGGYPEWSPNGRELYYVSLDAKLMAVSLQINADSIQPSAPRELFQLPEDDSGSSPYAVAPDGKRFLVRTTVNQESKPLEVIANWPALLKSVAK